MFLPSGERGGADTFSMMADLMHGAFTCSSSARSKRRKKVQNDTNCDKTTSSPKTWLQLEAPINSPYYTSQPATVYQINGLSTNTAQLVKDKTPSLGGDAWCMSIHSQVGWCNVDERGSDVCLVALVTNTDALTFSSVSILCFRSLFSVRSLCTNNIL